MPGELFLVIALALLGWLGSRPGARPVFQRLLGVFKGGLALLFSSLSLPLGPEERVVRRQPWVTYAIVGLCVGVFQLQLVLEPGPEWRGRYAQARKEAVAYAVAHPYLDLPPALDALAGWEVVRKRREAGVHVEPPDLATRAREQAELDAAAEGLQALLRERPQWRWADARLHSTWFTQVRSTFVHGDWMHLVGNMVFLLAFGPYVEDVFGRVLFAVLYLGAGLAGGLASNAVDPGRFVFSFGASGAISGVMGAFLVRFANRRLALLHLPSLWLPMVRVRASVPACGFLLFSLLKDVRGAWLDTPGIGWWAHLGGFAFGVLVAGLLHVLGIERHFIDPRIEAGVTLTAHPAVERSFDLRVRGHAQAALRTAEAALAERPEDPALLREAYDAALAAGNLDRAGWHATRLVARLGAWSDPVHARETLWLVQEVRDALGGAPPARFLLAAADALERQGQAVAALLIYEELAGHREAPIARRAGAREARLRVKLGAGSARRAAVPQGRGLASGSLSCGRAAGRVGPS